MKQSILYSFVDGSSGPSPYVDLTLGGSGKIYGATAGVSDAFVFELAPPAKSGEAWTENVICDFCSGAYTSISSLISDGKSRLYGTTYDGGRYHFGSVFVLTKEAGSSWKEQDIYSFQSNDGNLVFPGGLVLSAAGVLYGVAAQGGPSGSYLGTVFSLTPPSGDGPWTESTLYTFENTTAGYRPLGTLAIDSAGTLYGTTLEGGLGGGNVFELVPPAVPGGTWIESVLYSFLSGSDGAQPIAGVIFDSTGALYGTTQFGGNFACSFGGGEDGCGTAFKLIPPSTQGGTWTEETLHAFAGGNDGVDPGPSQLLILGTTIYGTTLQGGDPETCDGVGCGTVFEITQ